MLRRVCALLLVTALAACTTVELEQPVPALSSEKYAAIVVDANNGRVLHEVNASSPRIPASLTKMMTLYMLFDAMEQGRLGKASEIPVSAYAARREPSKLYMKAGQSIDVDTAIRALATKSANDVATAVAEHLAGSEDRFASEMTGRARSLGMTSTSFGNASGLPDPQNRTSARDMALLGMALKRRFPQHYHYFGEREFGYRGKTIRGHNHMLGNVRGVDGIKTGYVRASGYNIATSVSRGGKRLVVVVMGAESGKSRNAHCEELIERFLPRASG